MIKMVKADRPEVEGLQYHIRCAPGDVSRYVLMPGDPWRVPKIADLFDTKEEIAFHREYRTFTGEVDGIRITASSSGLGPSPLGVAIEELAAIGVDAPEVAVVAPLGGVDGIELIVTLTGLDGTTGVGGKIIVPPPKPPPPPPLPP